VTLPDLLIIGAPKAGTSSLFTYLAQHPDICPSSKKETNYFSALSPDGRSGPVADYERFFAHRGAERFALEATPSYFYQGPRVRQAIRETLDSPRLLLVLREPVERLWSAYTFQRSLGHLSGIHSFDAYVAACEQERRTHPSILDQGFRKGLSIGMYGDHVPAWADMFGPDLRVLFFDDLRSDPAGVVRDLCAWLAIDPEIAASFSYDARNPTLHPRSVAAARAAAVARSVSHRVLRYAPGARQRLRGAYLRLNSGSIEERPSAQITEHLAQTYDASNRATAEALLRHGTEPLPAWLNDTVASTR
jgi:hypothetical protein